MTMQRAAFLLLSFVFLTNPVASQPKDKAKWPPSPHIAATEPLRPEAQLKKMKVPPGFEIQLVASDPDIRKPINIAVMGCAVNGPGEASGADIGIAAGDGEGLIYIDGKISRKVKEEDMVVELMKEIEARWGDGKSGDTTHAPTVGRWVAESEMPGHHES